MATHAANDLTYYLVLDRERQNDLAAIRHWENLKAAFDAEQIWISELNEMQVRSVEVKSIPYKRLYTARNGKLFPVGSNLPERNVPGSLLWTPIARAMPVRLPSLNHNYFGIQEKQTVRLVASEHETDAVAMLVPLAVLSAYLEQAPAVRLQPLSWAVLNHTHAFVCGTPLLPVPGATYWKRGRSLLPAGYDFELPVLTDVIDRALNPENDSWIAWNPDSSWFTIPKHDLQPLTISSYRSTTLYR